MTDGSESLLSASAARVPSPSGAVSEPGPHRSNTEPRTAAAVHVLIALLWSGVLPALATALMLRYLIPPPWHPAARGALQKLAVLYRDHTLIFTLLAFLLFAAFGRYWGNQIVPEQKSERVRAHATSWKQVAGWSLWLAGAAALALVLRGSVVQSSRVQGTSMLPTLHPGDYLLTNKLAYELRIPGSSIAFARSAPARGDVVVFENPDRGTEYSVKRVIGLPGDSITMKDGPPFINGWKVPNCFAGHYTYISAGSRVTGALYVEFLEQSTYLTVYTASYRNAFGPYEVRPGEMFVVGDNRTTSHDSRSWNGGRGAGLTHSMLVGRAERIAAGIAPDDRLDLSVSLRRLGIELRPYGMDVRALENGIRHCVGKRPKNTSPPAPAVQSARAK